MNKLNAPAFRKSMSGYKKDDVNNYILTLNRKYSEAEKDYKHSLSKANAEIDSLKVQLDDERKAFETTMSEKDMEIENANSRSEAFQEEIKLKNAENSAEVEKYIDLIKNALTLSYTGTRR